MTKESKHTYQAETIGLPPLQMVLVQMEGDDGNLPTPPMIRPRRTLNQAKKKEVVLKLIKHLKNKKP